MSMIGATAWAAGDSLDFEITPYGAYRFGGTFDIQDSSDASLGLRLHLILHRTGGRRQVDRDVDLAAVDLALRDEAEGDDVLEEVGVLDTAQGVHDLITCDGAHGDCPPDCGSG